MVLDGSLLQIFFTTRNSSSREESPFPCLLQWCECCRIISMSQPCSLLATVKINPVLDRARAARQTRVCFRTKG